MNIKPLLLILFCVGLLNKQVAVMAQKTVNPIHQNIKQDTDGNLYLELNDKKYNERENNNKTMVLDDAIGNPVGTNKGLSFNFNKPSFVGKLYFGFIPYGEAKHPQPVYFKKALDVKKGQVSINIKDWLSGKYDMIGWEKNGKGAMGYRLINEKGEIIYDGIINFSYNGERFDIDDTVIEGPFVNILSQQGAVISFTTNTKIKAIVEVNGKTFIDKKDTKLHEIELSELKPNTKYDYTILFGDNQLKYSFKTAPKPGSRTKFTFAYASDSRGGQGGGERNMNGPNAYIVKKLLGLAYHKGAAFAQFTGDLVDGYANNTGAIDLEYANWKRTAGLYGPYMPIYCTMGNHEVIMHTFIDSITKKLYSVDRFPYDEQSSEAVFGRNFTNPNNGPESEDGAWFDPDFKHKNFPSYKENVYYYTYDNVAMIVLNSDYLYAPSLKSTPAVGGNLHGFLLDNQMKWLEETLALFEKDKNIDHVFVTQHTPAFPNGGHVGDDMWYGGDNLHRPVIGETAHKKGIIECRDEYLDLLFNKSTKVVAILTGDEHNYNRLRLDKNTTIYNNDYKGNKLTINRKIYQINNGAAGAPYYAQEVTPWSEAVEHFSTLNAVVLFEVEGKTIKVTVLNPDTFELVDEFILVN